MYDIYVILLPRFLDNYFHAIFQLTDTLIKFDFFGPRECLNQCLRSRLSIIRSKKVAYELVYGELVLVRYTEFCRIKSVLSKTSSLLGSGYPRVRVRVARGAYAGEFRSIWSEVLKGIGLLSAILSPYQKVTEESLEPLGIM